MPTLETLNGYPLWHYIPSLPAAVIFTILFAVATIFHTHAMLRNRTWFCLPFVIGGAFEAVGYIGRALAYNATGQEPPYIMQSVLLLLGPVLFAASLYMTLGRVISAVDGHRYSFIPARMLTRIFVFGDVFSFLIQSSGAGLIVSDSSKSGSSSSNSNNNSTSNSNNNVSSSQTGEDVIVAGLVFQVIMFGIFITAALSFHLRFRRSYSSSLPHSSSSSHQAAAAAAAAAVPWRSVLGMLYATSAFIMIRNVFRAVQYAMGQDGYLLTQEWPLYVFDSILMLGTMVAFCLRYPSYLSRGGGAGGNGGVGGKAGGDGPVPLLSLSGNESRDRPGRRSMA